MPRFVMGPAIARAAQAKAERRARMRAQRERVRVRALVRMWVGALHVSRAQREWRILLLTGPDTRSLTGRLLGDPRYERSALYARRMGLS